MKKTLPILIGLFYFTGLASAQVPIGSIKGKIIDTVGNQPLSDATVAILRKTDSSLVTYSLSNKLGQFEIKYLDSGDYRVFISFQGYQTFKNDFSIRPNKKLIDFGDIRMEKEYKLLGEVVVSDDAPIKIKNDTIEFKSQAFKTRPNAMVEDLLKKVPGMQVDKDGAVKAQGEQVQKIYVDGKEFFGTDPKLATKNLTADMVESVQVFDDMSDQAKFTKVDDGSRQKAINIKLKKEKRKGSFGRISAGVGTDDRYEFNGTLNHFNGDQQLSILANANNINKQGFSFSDIITATGGYQGTGNVTSKAALDGVQVMGTRGGFGMYGNNGFSGGINRSISAGFNYNNYITPKLRLGTNYFFSNTHNITEKDVFRQTFFAGDSTTELHQDYLSNGTNQNHRFNVKLEYLIDSANSILYTPSLNIQHSEISGDDTSSTYAVNPFNKYLAIAGATSNVSDRSGLIINNNLLFRHRFRKAGRTFTIGWSNSYAETDVNGLYKSLNNFYDTDTSDFPDRIIVQDQNARQKTRTNSNVVSSSYTEPLGKDKLLELNYAYSQNRNTSDKSTYNFDSTSGKYEILNPVLTNYFENTFEANRVGVNFRMQKKQFNYQLGTAVQFSTLESQTYLLATGKDSLIRTSYRNFFPTANVNYQMNRNKTFRFRYNGRTTQPTTAQLQNVLDQSNPVQWRIGNPELKQEFNHNVNATYNSFDVLTFKFLAANFSFNTTSNKIVNSKDSVSKGIELIRPVNLNGGVNTSSFVTLGLPFKNDKLRGSSVNLTNSISYARDVSMLYKQKNIGKTISITQGAGLNFDLLNERLDLGVNASLSYYNVRYSVNASLSENYFAQAYSADFSLTLPGNIVVGSDFDYYVNSGRADGFNQTLPLWNASIALQFLKNKNAELKFSCNDIFDQNQTINRVAYDNYIEDSRTNVIRRYFMIGLLVNLNRVGKNANLQQHMSLPKQIERALRNLRFVN